MSDSDSTTLKYLRPRVIFACALLGALAAASTIHELSVW